MRLRSNIEPEDQEVLKDHGGSRKRRASTQDVSPVVLVPPPKKQKSSAKESTSPKTTWKCHASTRDASPDIQAPARKKQIQIQMSMSKEDVRRREIFFNAMATIDRHQELERLKAERNSTIHGYVLYGRQRASNTKRSNGKAVRFENGELTPCEQLEGDTERRMSELDGNLLKEISDEVDRELAELSEEENDKQTTCEYGHEREQGDIEEGDSSSMVQRSSEGIIVSQKDVVKSTTNSSRTSEPQSGLPPEALQIEKHYGALKVSAWKWAVKHFPEVPNSTKSSLILPGLAETSPELMEFVNYISACTDKSWEYIFNEQRPKLVYGILGKMLEVLVFGHEMFGATDEQLQILKERDLGKVHADALHRNTSRFNLISTFTTPPADLISSLSTLQASFLHMLHPLLPSPSSTSAPPSLSRILQNAATLSLLARRQQKTLYHFSPHPATGSPFSRETMHALNPMEVRKGNTTRLSSDIKIVTMTGWPACVAYASTRSKKKRKVEETILGKAEVLLQWGAMIKPLSIEPENWLGPSLREEMESRQKWVIRQREQRKAVVGVGLATGMGLVGLWAVQRAGVMDGVEGWDDGLR